jgi:hypothetical protein
MTSMGAKGPVVVLERSAIRHSGRMAGGWGFAGKPTHGMQGSATLAGCGRSPRVFVCPSVLAGLGRAAYPAAKNQDVDPRNKSEGDEMRKRRKVSCPVDSFANHGFVRISDQPPELNRTAMVDPRVKPMAGTRS